MAITPLPTPPSRTNPSTFSSLADAFLGALPTFATEANALETNVNAKEVLAVAAAANAAASEDVAMAAANYKGAWSAQSGAANVPYSVSHLNKYWMLVSNLANVAAKTPGTDAEWALIDMTGGNPSFLTDLIRPSKSGGLRDLHRGGWNLPLNQQWGGHLMPLPDGSWGDTALACVNWSTAGFQYIGASNTAAEKQYAFSIKPAKTITVASLFVGGILKQGNPTDNLQLTLYTDSSGPSGAVTNGAATAIAGTLITSDANGKIYEFVFATPPTLNANTRYWAWISRSGANDASNYYRLNGLPNASAPPGCVGMKADNTPTWASTTCVLPFWLKPTSGYQFLQTGGQFDAKLVGNSAPLPINQADYIWRKLDDGSGWFDRHEGTWKMTWTVLTKDKTFLDIGIALDHDRIVLRCNATTGYIQLDHYDGAGTKHTVTGTTDCSSGTHDIGFKYRFKADGSDFLYLYVDGVSEGTPITSHSFAMSQEWFDNGHATLLGGMPLAPTWTGTTLMGTIPSGDGWTYDGASTEAAHAVVSGGKLYIQIPATNTDTCSWHRHDTFSNANGWELCWKTGVKKASDVTGEEEAVILMLEDAKYVRINMHTYYIETLNLATNYKIQIDMTISEHVFTAKGKGSDFYLYCDGRLIVDGTGLLTTASTDDRILFGDNDATAGSNAESVWDYIKWYKTAAVLPEYTGGSLHELAVWSGDQSVLLPILYNGGTYISAKEYCGISGNYVKRVLRSWKREGITVSPTTASTSATLLTDLEAFVFGECLDAEVNSATSTGAAGAAFNLGIRVDGGGKVSRGDANSNDLVTNTPSTNNYPISQTIRKNYKLLFGLHKIEGVWSVTSDTGTSNYKMRNLTIQEVE